MADKNSYDKDLVSILAHDLRTPISSVRSFIDLIQHAGPVNEQQAKFIDRAMLGLGRMETLVNDVLEMSRADSDAPLHKVPCDLAVIITDSTDVLEGLAVQNQIQVHLNLPKKLTLIEGDQQMLRQVVNNLIGNAIKYNEPGGEVWVEAKNIDDGVQLIVRDNGLGIDKDEIPHIFERFYRARDGKERRIDGTGLGLAIVDTIVQRHQGRIEVDSAPGEGTTFTVYLPSQ